MKKIIKKPLFLILGIVIVVAVVVFIIFGGNGFPKGEIVISIKGDVISEVSVTGRVKAARDVNLGFDRVGRVSKVYAEVGEKIAAGNKIVQLENSDLQAQLKQAEADLKAQEAKLSELQSGTRPEDIEIKRTELEKAKQDLVDEYNNVIDVINDAYSKAEDAIRKQTADVFSKDDTNPQLTFNVNDSSIKNKAESDRFFAIGKLKQWRNELSDLNANPVASAANEAIQNSKSHLIIIRNSLISALDAAVHESDTNISDETINTYKTNINTARVNVNTAITNINNQEQTITSQKLTIQKTQNELDLKLAGNIPDQIAAQEAQVEKARAGVENTNAQLNKTVIYAPFSGIITKQDARTGSIITSGATIVSMISGSKFEIETNIPEVEIAKVKVGDSASVILDAYSKDDIFKANVIAIDPSETIVSGVSTYKTTLQLINEDSRVKPGMTANIEILNEKKEGVIMIPIRAIIFKNNIEIVQTIDGNKIKELPVKTGLRGSDGNVEIIEGLNEGVKVIVPAAN